MNFKRLTLTDIKIDIKRVPNKKTLVAALEAAGMYKAGRVVLVFMAVTDLITKFSIYVQMSRTNGKAAHGEENSLFKRREPHLMISTGSRLCWQRLRSALLLTTN